MERVELKTFLTAKIHRIPVTAKSIDYSGSATIGRNLLEALDGAIQPYERVQIVNISTGARWETYVIAGEEDDSFIANGAAARLVEVGDLCIVMAYGISQRFEGCSVINFTSSTHWQLSYCSPDTLNGRSEDPPGS
ncbi:MAG: aspartate alpha-decarboxylase [Acidimicrobiaceae bacterium]|nr:aspartate alpha-decarboxylase [Acidimicrobiaceae bacterium]